MRVDGLAPRAPELRALLPDGPGLSRRQLVTALLRPALPLLAFGVFASRGWWVLAAVAVMFVFATDVVVLHDLFHRNLGLGQRMNGVLTTAYGVLLLNSGHALGRTHRRHHRVYPRGDDPEAYVDGWPIWRVVAEGPLYRFRIWAWAWRNRGRDTVPMAAEFAVWFAAWTSVFTIGAEVPGLRAYVVVAELGSWAFPLISVTGVHDRHATGPLRQARTLRDPVLGRLMLGMHLHLEHHLYPRVPAARLPELAAALTPWLLDNGAAVWTRGELAPSARAVRPPLPTT